MRSAEVIRRSEQLALGRNDVELHRAVAAKKLLRIAPGSYVRPEDWAALDPIEQHRMRVIEYSRRLHPDTVYSHFAAAAVWGIRMLSTWPDEIHVTAPPSRGGRSEGKVRRHCTLLGDAQVTEQAGLRVTTPARTVVDLARILPFTDAVVAMDSALRTRGGNPLANPEDIALTVDSLSGRAGSARALAAAGFATPLSDSPEESHSRVLLHTLGFPRPELQRSFQLPDGGTAEVDFYWEEFGHAGECDGRSKYRDARILRGRRPEDVVIEEKNRENQLRRIVGRLSRWEPAELYSPRRFYDHLTRDGLRSYRPRP